ncbi:hypothetical protein ACQJBY_048418 [Aegilops geniculata]
MCRLVMATYAPPDLLAAPPLLLDPSNVVRRRTYAGTRGRVTPYLVYLDHPHADFMLALPRVRLRAAPRQAPLRRRLRPQRPPPRRRLGARQGERPAPGPPRPVPRLHAHLHGPLPRRRRRRHAHHGRRAQPRQARQGLEGPHQVLRHGPRPLYVAQPRRQIRRCHQLRRAADE